MDGDTRMGRWWKAADDRELEHQALGAALAVDQETQPRQHAICERYAMYGENAGLPDYIPRRRVERMAHNVLAGIADTIVTEVTQTVPRPLWYTVGGTYSERKDAERLTSACDCKFEAEDMETIGPDVLLDAVLAGCGFFSIAAEHDDEVRIRRLFPIDVVMDDSYCVGGRMPRSLYLRRFVEKALLWELYPDSDHRLAIESAGTRSALRGSLWSAFIRTQDLVETWECFHLPSKPEADDGRRCLVINGAVLEDEEWTEDTYPIVAVRCLLPRIGYWGEPIIARGEPDQLELNVYARRTREGAHRIGVPRVYARPGTVTKTHLNNTIGAIVECTEKPVVETPVVFPPEHYRQMERHKEWAHHAVGISELSVTSQIPAGMAGASGRSQLVYRHHQSRRLVGIDRLYGAAHCAVALEWLKAETKLAGDSDEPRKVEYEERGRRDQIEWSKLSKRVDAMRIKLAPTSALAKDPAARLEGVQELVEKGVLSPQEGLRMADNPDFQRIRDEQTAHHEMLEQMFQRMLEGGEYVPPDPFQPLELGKQLCLVMHSLGVRQGAEEEDLAKLRLWFEHAETPNLGIEGEPAAAALPPEGMAPGALPPDAGGPALPPTGLPPGGPLPPAMGELPPPPGAPIPMPPPTGEMPS